MVAGVPKKKNLDQLPYGCSVAMMVLSRRCQQSLEARLLPGPPFFFFLLLFLFFVFFVFFVLFLFFVFIFFVFFVFIFFVFFIFPGSYLSFSASSFSSSCSFVYAIYVLCLLHHQEERKTEGDQEHQPVSPALGPRSQWKPGIRIMQVTAATKQPTTWAFAACSNITGLVPKHPYKLLETLLWSIHFGILPEIWLVFCDHVWGLPFCPQSEAQPNWPGKPNSPTNRRRSEVESWIRPGELGRFHSA